MPPLIDLLPLVPGLPLLGVILLALFGGRMPGRAAGWLASALVGLAFLLALGIGAAYLRLPPEAAGVAGAGAVGAAGTGESPVGATEHGGEGAADSDAAASEHAAEAARRPAIVQSLWRWIAVGDDMLRLTVALQPLDPLKEIPPEAVGTRWVALDRLPADFDPSRLWDAERLVGQRPLQAIPALTPLTVDMIPPLAGTVEPEAAVAPPAYLHRFVVDAALQLDGLSLLMVLVVTGVGFLIHVYSLGYMGHDADIRRYFLYLNLFVFSMLTLVLAANFLVLFVGWELVGACSYLLIGFWHRDPANASAGRKAFIVNRVGDFAFLLGLMLIWTSFGSLAFGPVFAAAPQQLALNGGLAIAICALLLVGATGKSAQIPLYVWLPDAMAGPTPVSALIHAATMVTAGIYMIVRSASLFEQAPVVLAAVALVGGLTALLAALIALVQVDIKRVLAYSTISQLGFMFLAVGSGAYVAAMFHLTAHAFFKALLFLGAGSFMHALEHGFRDAGAHPPAEDGVPAHQDMRRMGGLLRRTPITGWTFLIGGLALAGVFPLAGFWSKDEILLELLAQDGAFWRFLLGLGLVTAFLTALYTGRQLLLVLAGPPRSEGAERAHESPPVMTLPLVALAALTVLGGLLGLSVLGRAASLPALLEPVVGAHHAALAMQVRLILALVASALALGGLGLAWSMYGSRRRPDPARLAAALPRAQRWLWNKLYVDELYLALFVRPFRAAADFLWRVVDDDLVDGAVNGLGRLTLVVGQGSRRWQSGQLRAYALSMLAGAVLIGLWLFMGAR